MDSTKIMRRAKVKKTMYAFILFGLILMSGCQAMNEEQPEQAKETEETNPKEGLNDDVPEKSEEEMVLEEASKVISLLKDKDAEELANYVHEDKGVLFSPYAHIEEDAVTVKKEEVVEVFQSQEKKTWGTRDGSGEPIELTPHEYYSEFVYDANYHEADEVVLDPTEPRGNTLKNIKELFSDAHVVEYYVKGTEENDNMDWKALNLVFEKDQTGEWKLVAVVHDQWTI